MRYVSCHARIAPGVVIHPEARIMGRAVIDKQEDLLVIGPVHGGYFTAYRDADIGVRVVRLCYSGTIDGYEADLMARCHGNAYHVEACRAAIARIKEHFNL